MTNTKCNPYKPVPTQDFDNALKFTLKWEGGISTDQKDPGNKGGNSTAYGITQPVYDEYRSSINQNKQPVTNITDNEIKELYRKKYYIPSGANLMPAPLGGVVFDTAVNHGVSKAIKFLQQSVNTPVTGKLDHDSLNKVICESDSLAVSEGVISERISHYNRLGESPKYSRFLKGWLNRVSDLSTLIGMKNR